MTEEEWLACDDPEAMLSFLEGRASARRLRMFAAACCRRAWRFLPDVRSRAAVEAAERYADGLIHLWELKRARQDAQWAYRAAQGPGGAYFRVYAVSGAAQVANEHLPTPSVARRVLLAVGSEELEQERRHQLLLLRDIAGNPFRPLALNLSLLTPTITSLAQSAYDDRLLPAGHLDPQRLSVLADAVEEAGCGEAELLEHLRGPGPHVRGCHAVDLRLGKG